MPLFEFECNDCSTHFERILKRRSRSPRCPDCGGRSRRLLSAPAIQFKGTGWYVTDYAGKNKKETDGGKPGGKEAAGDSVAEGKAKKDSESPAAKKKDGGKKSGGAAD